jgi:preprotein translocase subunit SecD
MLQFTRVQTAAILVTVLVVCGFAVPNFVSDDAAKAWPDWAQRRIALAPELQGGTTALVELDYNDVREQVLTLLLHDVRSDLRDAHISLTDPVAVRSGNVEVRPLAGDFEAALAQLRELSRPLSGVRSVEVTDAGSGLIRVTPTEAGVREYEPMMVDHAIDAIRARLVGQYGVPATVEREGANRVRVQVPKFGPEVLYRRD